MMITAGWISGQIAKASKTPKLETFLLPSQLGRRAQTPEQKMAAVQQWAAVLAARNA